MSDQRQPQLPTRASALDRRAGRKLFIKGVSVPQEIAWADLDQATGTRVAAGIACLISLTLAADTFNKRAVSRMPLPSPNAERMRPTLNGVIGGRPSRLPST
jgi:hypothetical protein